jgi:hypothetical protein
VSARAAFASCCAVDADELALVNAEVKSVNCLRREASSFEEEDEEDEEEEEEEEVA